MPQISPRLMLNFKKRFKIPNPFNPAFHSYIDQIIHSIIQEHNDDSIMQQCPQPYVQTHNNHALITIVGCGKIFCDPDPIGKTKLAEA